MGWQLFRRPSRSILAVVVAVAAILIPAGVAFASQQPPEPGTLGIPYGGFCTSGTYHGYSIGTLTNGLLTEGNCRSGTKLTAVAVEYRRDSGSGTLTARFGWQFTNSSGSAYLNGDLGPTFTQPVGSWRHQIFYYTGLAFPAGYPCVRGILAVGGTTYVTKVQC